MTPRQVQVSGKPLLCDHCGHDCFLERDAQLNTALMEFLDLSWMNKSAHIYVCVACGKLHWFLEPQSALSHSNPSICFNCNTRLSSSDVRCPNCGSARTDETSLSNPPQRPPVA